MPAEQPSPLQPEQAASIENQTGYDPYQAAQRMAEAKQHFIDIGLPVDEQGLIEQNLSQEQLNQLIQWNKETSEGGDIMMPTEQLFYQKTYLAASLWRQQGEAQPPYLAGKGWGAEVSLRGSIDGRVKRPATFSYRPHSDFELYAVDYDADERGGNLGTKRVYTDQFLAVFNGQEYYPFTKTKGMSDLPPDLLLHTAETVHLGDIDIKVPELELQFIDKYMARESTPRPEGHDALLLAEQYQLDRQKIHDYLEQYVIIPCVRRIHQSAIDAQEQITAIERRLASTRSYLEEEEQRPVTTQEVVDWINHYLEHWIEPAKKRDIHTGGITMKYWLPLSAEQIDENNRIIDPTLGQEIQQRADQDTDAKIESLNKMHEQIDELLNQIEQKYTPET